jgi:hypothetical protein
MIRSHLDLEHGFAALDPVAIFQVRRFNFYAVYKRAVQRT